MTLTQANTDPRYVRTTPVHPGGVDLPKAWRSAEFDEAALFVDVPPTLNEEIKAALEGIDGAGLDIDTLEQEDIRLPSMASAVEELWQRLDHGQGVAVLRGLALHELSERHAEIASWGLSNYIGQPMRQGLKKDRRIFTVTDHQGGYKDPTRIGATRQTSRQHTDNGCLEPRPPNYVFLACYRAAKSGGESTLTSGYAVHEAFRDRRPDLLPLLYQPFHFLPPKLHTWPQGPSTIMKPIFESARGELFVHYAKVMVEPGMELAGKPLNAEQREALDLLDEILEDESVAFVYGLKSGEVLLNNNLTTLHGRLAYDDDPSAPRNLKRLWLWRRHGQPGTDPIALDKEEFQS